jgi:hypothetical protein
MYLIKAQQRVLLQKRRSIAALTSRRGGVRWIPRTGVTRDTIASLRRDVRSILGALVILRKRERHA